MIELHWTALGSDSLARSLVRFCATRALALSYCASGQFCTHFTITVTTGPLYFLLFFFFFRSESLANSRLFTVRLDRLGFLIWGVDEYRCIGSGTLSESHPS